MTVLSNSRWRSASRVLCVRLDNLGDVLMTTPAIRALRRGLERDSGRRPHITLLGSSAGCAVARHVPEIDAVLVYDAPWVAAGREAPLRSDIGSRLAAHRFDAAIFFTCYSQSVLPAAMMAGQAGIPLRLGHCRENPYALLTDWVRDPEPGAGIRHEVERQCALVEAVVGAPDADADERLSCAVSRGACDRLAAIFAARGMSPGDDDADYIVVHPGATAESRRWPAERFGAVAAALHRETGLPIVVTGGPSERDVVARVVEHGEEALGRDGAIHGFAGELALDEMIAAVDGAALLVSNNSGPVHIAAARQTPVVVLYAATNPQHTPWRVPNRMLTRDVPCANCQRSICPVGHHACLAGIDADEVVAASLELLDETAAQRSARSAVRSALAC